MQSHNGSIDTTHTPLLYNFSIPLREKDFSYKVTKEL